MTPRLALFVLLTAIPIAALQTSAQELDTLKDVTENWIQTRTRISEEESRWESQKELLKSSIETLISTRDNLEDNVKILETQSKKQQDSIAEANAKVAAFEETNQTILDQVAKYEKRILNLFRRLPEPLKDKLAPLIRKIPSNIESTEPPQNRLQNVVAIATIIDEFNNDLTLTHTIKPLDNGEVIEVRVLYWGLAGAYAANAEGNKAWILKPQEGEWEWTAETENAAAIKQLFDVYDKSIDPTLVRIPFSFQMKGAEG